MSKLKELIDKLCPNGVEYKKLGDIADIIKGKQLNKTAFVSNGKFPVINGGVEISGYYTNYNFKENTITISQGGASAGYVNYVRTKFWAGGHCYVVSNIKNEINYKYIYYNLKNNEMKLINSQHGAGIPVLALRVLNTLEIPVPPLEVQEEIVRILDCFTELTTNLNKELEKELAARKTQYEYYRDELLKNNDWQVVKLGEIAKINRGKRVTKKDLLKNEEYPVYQNSLIPLGYYSESNCKKGSTILISAGAAGQIAYIEKKFWAADDCFYFECSELITNKFLYYLLKGNQLKIMLKVRKASIPRLPRQAVENLKINLPPLEEQERIVKILDNFESLINDISIGLPAEIEARTKQYEYYRDRILSFNKI